MNGAIDKSTAANALGNLQQGTYGTEGSLLDFLWYDRFTLANATTSHILFQSPTGVNGRTLADTNVTGAGQVPQGQNWKIHAFKIMVTADAAADAAALVALATMLNETTMDFIISNKATQFQAVLADVMGLTLNAGLAITQNVATFGTIKGVYPLNREITLAALTPYRVEINHWTASPAALDGWNVRIGFITDLTRAGS